MTPTASVSRLSWRPWRWSLHWQILLALGLAVVTGRLLPQDAQVLGVHPADIYEFVGMLFLRGLKMVIVPLIAGSIISGVAGVGAGHSLGRMFGKTFAWYVSTSLLATLTGLLLVNVIRPGLSHGVPVGPALGLDAQAAARAADLGGKGAGDLVHILVRMIPENPLAAAAGGEMLSLIFFCLVYGAAVTQLPAAARERHLAFWEALFQVMMRITSWVIACAPVGIFGLVAHVVATSGFAAFGPLARYGLTVLLALAIHAALTLPLLIASLTRLPPHRHVRAMAPALLTAFSTRSSSATLPLTIQRVETGAGVSNRVSSFMLPLGATINMDGTALYECVAVLFIAQAYGVSLSVVAQGIVVVTALLASIGAAGIPAAGLVMMSIILEAVGLPLEGVALILAIDPVLDMCRTTVNVWSDACGALVVASSEGETGLLDATSPPPAT